MCAKNKKEWLTHSVVVKVLSAPFETIEISAGDRFSFSILLNIQIKLHVNVEKRRNQLSNIVLHFHHCRYDYVVRMQIAWSLWKKKILISEILAESIIKCTVTSSPMSAA